MNFDCFSALLSANQMPGLKILGNYINMDFDMKMS